MTPSHSRSSPIDAGCARGPGARALGRSEGHPVLPLVGRLPSPRGPIFALLLLGACVPWETRVEEGHEVLERSGQVGADFRVVHRIDVGETRTSFHLTMLLEEEVLGYVERLVGPDGEDLYVAKDWWESDFNRSNAGFASSVVVVDWPIDARDPPLTAGTYKVITRADVANSTYHAQVALKTDPNLDRGSVRVELTFAADLESEDELVRGTEQAVQALADEIFGELQLEVIVDDGPDWDGPAFLASPGFGSREDYLEVVGSKPIDAVPLLIIDGFQDGNDIFGVAGGIPGPMFGSDRSVVTVSARESAGRDGRFSAEEERLFAETMAHEVSHYLGLFHPAELPSDGGSVVNTWDNLPDTSVCASFEDCTVELGDNLMFPTPLCADSSGFACTAFLRQRALTPSQQGVVQRYTGVQ